MNTHDEKNIIENNINSHFATIININIFSF